MTATALNLVQAMVRTSLGRVALICDREALTSKRPMVLLIHGALRRSDVLASWYGILAPHYDVFLVDMPGHGRSPGEGPATIASIAARLKEIIQVHFRSRAIVVIGESTGGIVAATLGDGTIEAVRGVVASDPPLTAAKQWPVQHSFLKAYQRNPNDQFIRAFGDAVFGITEDGKVQERIYYDVFQRVAVPTLLLTGDLPLWPTTGRTGVPCLLDDVDRHIIASFDNRNIVSETIRDSGHLIMSPPGPQCRDLVMKFCSETMERLPQKQPGAVQTSTQTAPAAAKPREQIEAFLAEGFRGGALTAARSYWQAEPSASVARYITSLTDKLRPAGRTSVHRVAFLRSFTVEPMVPMLQAEAALDGCRVEAWVGDFNAYGQDILNPSSGLYASQPDTVVLAVLLRDISPALSDGFAELAEGDVEPEIERAAQSVLDLLTVLRSRTSAHVLVQGFERPMTNALGIMDGRRAMGQGDAVRALNARIRTYAAGERAITWLDYDDVQSRFGRKAWADDRKWLMARLPVSVDAMPHLAAAWWQHMAPVARPQAKVLVLDLDNTLWGGTVGEDGYAGLKVGSDYPGAFFRNLQRVALDLARRGVLITLASKNNEADAMEVIAKHPGMLIRPENLAAHRINWKPKPENLIDMAKELSLGLDSFVFVDDNPAEREAVRRLCPDVTVVELPKDPALYADALRRVAALERHGILAEDKERGRYYREERERRELMTGAGTLEDYLAALKVSVEIAPMTAATLARAAQLTQKTNQLNMTTRRYTETEMETLSRERGVEVHVLTASDRFGDNGLVGVAITRTKGKTCDIDTFLLSCRVIGRGVETAFLAYLSDGARARGATNMTGWFLPTAKNPPAAEIYKNAGFAAGEKNDKGGQLWTINLKTEQVAVPSWIALNPTRLSSVA